MWYGAAKCGSMGQHSVVAWGSTVWRHRAAQYGGMGLGAAQCGGIGHGAAQCGMGQHSVAARGSTVWRLGAA